MNHVEIAKIVGKRTDNVARRIKKEYVYRVERVLKTNGSGYVDVYVLSEEDAKHLIESLGYRNFAQMEHGALCAIEQVLGITLVRQYIVGDYRIDGYCVETNTAYEIDEPQHFIEGELRQECKDRQTYIESVLGCSTVRIKV